ncbi:hypothetical protein DQ04_01561070 [Trypanosoma grayi]|uniref:hypothetical protein n=1 Tax=Trypanosoma grayi TaxID=71804 RepID=UPI0004F473E1|nr:hypothetical protein DQ04_01561070 [Trypanosoma grayi]KEG12640.1 hypothetical protein DQ04_01561070 [Trypanosoma grayi]
MSGSEHSPSRLGRRLDSLLRGDWAALRNPNVQRVLLFCFIDGACFSLWYAQAFQILINRMAGDTTVGWLSATSGMAQMLGALFVGFFVSVRRQTVVRIGAVCGLFAAALSIYGVTVLRVPVFFFASLLWGAYSGIIATGTETLFADSVETGRRDFVYNLKWINQTLCDCVGSFTSLIMLLRLGNDWDIGSLQKLICTGYALHPIAHLLLFTMKDKYTLDEKATRGTAQVVIHVESTDDEQLSSSPMKQVVSPTDCPFSSQERFVQHEIDADNTLGTSLSNSPVTTTPRGAAKTPEDASLEREALLFQIATRSERRHEEFLAAQCERNSAGRLAAAACYYANWMYEWSAVPYLVCLVDFLVAVGSGMTMRYIPLFLVNDHGVSPVILMGTYITVSVVTAGLSLVVRHVGERYMSRVAAVILVRVIGATLLLIMGLTHLNLVILLPVFIIRNAMMNCTRGVTRSVIMDYVRKESRAKWSAFESFSSFTWAGSAVVGGYIAEAKGYQYTFVITAIFHYVALLTLSPAMYGAGEVEKLQREQKWREGAARSQGCCSSSGGAVSHSSPHPVGDGSGQTGVGQ